MTSRLFSFGVAFLASLALAEGDENILFTVDISGSMAGVLGTVGQSIAEQSSAPHLKDSAMALITFDGCGSDKVYTPVPLAKNNAGAIKDAARKLAPQGGTDIIAALNHTKKIIEKLLQETGYCARVILFTDNEDTCGNGNRHYEVLKELVKMCTDFKREFSIDVITTTVDEPTRLYLDGISNTTGGKTHYGGTVDEINEKVKTIVESHRKKKVTAPMTSKGVVETPKGEGGKAPPAVKAPQPEKQKATQGKEEKKEKKEGGS